MMPWTKKQERFMFAKHPDIAKKVTSEPGFYTKPDMKNFGGEAAPVSEEPEEEKKSRYDGLYKGKK